MMNNGIEMLNDTLSIFEKGYYYIENKPDGFELSLDIKPGMCGQGREDWIKQLALATAEDMDSTKPVKMETV